MQVTILGLVSSEGSSPPHSACMRSGQNHCDCTLAGPCEKPVPNLANLTAAPSSVAGVVYFDAGEPMGAMRCVGPLARALRVTEAGMVEEVSDGVGRDVLNSGRCRCRRRRGSSGKAPGSSASALFEVRGPPGHALLAPAAAGGAGAEKRTR